MVRKMKKFEEKLKPVRTLNTQQSKKGRRTFTIKDGNNLIIGNGLAFMTMETTEVIENVTDNEILKSSVLKFVDQYLMDFDNLFIINTKELIDALSYIKKDSKVYITLKADANNLTIISSDKNKMVSIKTKHNLDFEAKEINLNANTFLPFLKAFKNFEYEKIELCFKGDKLAIKKGDTRALICGVRVY